MKNKTNIPLAIIMVITATIASQQSWTKAWAFSPSPSSSSSSSSLLARRPIVAVSRQQYSIAHYPIATSCATHATFSPPPAIISLHRDNHPVTALYSSSLNDDDDDAISSAADDDDAVLPLPKLDQILSKLTSLFPFFVLGSAILGSYAPVTLNWVNRGNAITLMLAGVMLGTGMTLERSDFTTILTSPSQRTSVPVGVLCQFLLMPLSATLIGRTFLLPYHDPQTMAHLGKHLFLGLVLVGCSPGGTASNLVSLIAGADVALSVLLTACSTVLASVVTPLLTKWIVGSAIAVSGKALCMATAKVVLAPVALGVLLNEKMPRFCRWVSRFTPFASVVLVSLICGGVVANNSAMFMGGTAAVPSGAMSIPMLILLSVLITHTLGFTAGYLVPKHVFGFPERTARTISIETGMQNSALAVVLAKSIGADPLSYLPGALSATVHSCLGSGLAAFWRVLDSRSKKKEDGGDAENIVE